MRLFCKSENISFREILILTLHSLIWKTLIQNVEIKFRHTYFEDGFYINSIVVRAVNYNIYLRVSVKVVEEMLPKHINFLEWLVSTVPAGTFISYFSMIISYFEILEKKRMIKTTSLRKDGIEIDRHSCASNSPNCNKCPNMDCICLLLFFVISRG